MEAAGIVGQYYRQKEINPNHFVRRLTEVNVMAGLLSRWLTRICCGFLEARFRAELGDSAIPQHTSNADAASGIRVAAVTEVHGRADRSRIDQRPAETLIENSVFEVPMIGLL